jgi:hypothetical protein
VEVEGQDLICCACLVLRRPKVCSSPLSVIVRSLELMRYRWSFGGNRLQVKAETHLLTDVLNALKVVQPIGARPFGALASLQPKQDLLSTLLADEQTRLLVWLFPLDYHSKHHFASGLHHGANDVSIHYPSIVFPPLTLADYPSSYGEACLD